MIEAVLLLVLLAVWLAYLSRDKCSSSTDAAVGGVGDDYGPSTPLGEHLVEPHIPAPRSELSAEELRERLIALAPSTLELRRRLSEAGDD
jgi:hypothetical protein